MSQDFITIQEAAELSQKSAQTIRRAIKSKRLKTKKEPTAQGFNYLISRQGLISLYKIKSAPTQASESNEASSQTTNKATSQSSSGGMEIQASDLIEFNKTLQQLIEHHSQERQAYLRLIQGLQDKVVALENQFNLLKAAGTKRWYQFWKA